MGSYLWAGSPATVFVTRQTTQEARRDKIKTREYRRKITVRRLATAQARLKDLEMVTQKCQERAANPVVRGRGMICRADKYLAQRYGREPERIPGTVPVLPAFPDRPATPDDYHSAREPSESEYNTEEMDPEEDRDDVEGDDDDASVGSDTTSKSSSHNTDWTNRMTTANRTQRRNQRKRKESRGWHPTNAWKEEERCKGKVVLSLFWASPKEGALTYTDWRHEVEEYIRKGYDDSRIKDAMLSSVKGQAYVNFRSCNEGRNALQRRSWKRWTVSTMFPSPSGTWMPGCVGWNRESTNLSRHIMREWQTSVLNWNSIMGIVLVWASWRWWRRIASTPDWNNITNT